VLYALQGSPYQVAGSRDGTINFDDIVDIGWWISEQLGRESVSRAGRARKAMREREAKQQKVESGSKA